MNEEISKLRMQVQVRSEALEQAKQTMMPPVAQCAHQEKIIEAQAGLIAALESELSGAPAQSAPAAPAAPAKAAAPAAPKVTAPSKAATTTSAPAAAVTHVDTLSADTRRALTEYNKIDPNDAKAREAFRTANAKALGL